MNFWGLAQLCIKASKLLISYVICFHHSIQHNVFVRHIINKLVYFQAPSQNIFCAAFIYFLLYVTTMESKKILYIKAEYLLNLLKFRLKVKSELFGPTYNIVGLKMSTNEWWSTVKPIHFHQARHLSNIATCLCVWMRHTLLISEAKVRIILNHHFNGQLYIFRRYDPYNVLLVDKITDI